MVLFSCQHAWTPKDKETFMGGCVNGALKDMGEAKAKAYCSCMLEKLQKRYSSASDLKYAKTDTAVYSMGRECLK
jgi:hypothetical protein